MAADVNRGAQAAPAATVIKGRRPSVFIFFLVTANIRSANSATSDQRSTCRARFYFLLQRGDDFGEGLGAEVAFDAVADGDGAGFGFFCADYEHVRDFLHLVVGVFGGELLIVVGDGGPDVVVVYGFGLRVGVGGRLFRCTGDIG